MRRGFLFALAVLALLPSCRGTGEGCKAYETVKLNYPKSFEMIREAQADDRTRIQIRVKEYTRVAITISYDQIARTGRWVPHRSPAALPLSRAIEMATRWVARERADEGAIKVSRSFLARYGCRGEADHWYYVVGLSPFSLDGDRFEQTGASVVVLMDGTVIGPAIVE